MSYITKDSGQREDFATGARRDTQEGKTRFGLIPVPALQRLAALYTRGAVKYGLGNWSKGMPFSRVLESLERHLFQWIRGEQDEDHLAAVAWNAFTLMAYEHMIDTGRLPMELNDVLGKDGILDGETNEQANPLRENGIGGAGHESDLTPSGKGQPHCTTSPAEVAKEDKAPCFGSRHFRPAFRDAVLSPGRGCELESGGV